MDTTSQESNMDWEEAFELSQKMVLDAMKHYVPEELPIPRCGVSKISDFKMTD